MSVTLQKQQITRLSKLLALVLWMMPFLLALVTYLFVAIISLFQAGLSFEHLTAIAIAITLPVGIALIVFFDTEHQDEYHSKVMTRTALVATVLTLLLSVIWSLLEIFSLVPDFPFFLLVPVFFTFCVMAYPFTRRAYR